MVYADIISVCRRLQKVLNIAVNAGSGHALNIGLEFTITVDEESNR